MKSSLAKWGNSLALRIPKDAVEGARLSIGDKLELSVSKPGCIVIRKLRPKPTIEKLVSGITAKNRHHEIETGKPVGNEVW
ncbi:MAG: chpR [Acidobacteriales bacterium]|nr:chpR [Terriglobales bacterium]